MRYPVAVGTGFSAADDSLISLAIRYFTRPTWMPWPIAKKSHQFLIFWFANGDSIVHEALGGSGWTQKRGDKLNIWVEKSPKKHRYTAFVLPFSEIECAMIWEKSLRWLGTKSYSIKQIGAFAVSNSLLGRWLGLSVRPGPDDVICSEGACRIIAEVRPDLDARPSTDWPWDAVSPEMAYKYFSGRCKKNGGA